MTDRDPVPDDSVPAPPSAWQLAHQMGDTLPDPADLPDEVFALVDAARRLVDAVVGTDLDAGERAVLTAELEAITNRLSGARREPLIALGRHADGRIENLTQAGSGRLNPHAPALVFDPIDLPSATAEPAAIEVIGRTLLTDAHGGPPERAHGGVVATLLDETIGLAATVSGATGLTAGLNLRYRAGTPLHTPLLVRARYERSEGRKHFATGELVVADSGRVTAQADGVFITPG